MVCLVGVVEYVIFFCFVVRGFFGRSRFDGSFGFGCNGFFDVLGSRGNRCVFFFFDSWLCGFKGGCDWRIFL